MKAVKKTIVSLQRSIFTQFMSYPTVQCTQRSQNRFCDNHFLKAKKITNVHELKRYIPLSELEKNMNVYTGEKRLKCKYCPNIFM